MSQEQQSKAKAKLTRRQLGRLHELLLKYRENLRLRHPHGFNREDELDSVIWEVQCDITVHDRGTDEVKVRILQRD